VAIATPCAGLSDTGQRLRNEDRWLADPALGLYLVADGLGGADRGDEAAQWIVDGLPPLLRKMLRGVRHLSDPVAGERLREALRVLSAQVYEESCKHPALQGMGAAVVCALVWDRQALIAHLGDCRAYHFHDGMLEQLTRDHSTVQALIDEGRLTVTQAVRHPLFGRLNRYIGHNQQAEAELCFRQLNRGDRLLLCSDGLFAQMTNEEMAAILRLNQSPADACSLLVDTANEQGADDNITAVVVRI
jgi:serine/threonine protein phosphatase PrpC